MSRPTTRGKNKRHKKEENADDHSNLLRKIHVSGEITDDDVNKLFMIWKPVCKGCRVNSKDNPNCFCGLIPPPNGVRKSGLWQKMNEIIQSIGPVPSPDPRASGDWPAGLTNLGATCYANSILQFLYMNRSFRNAVFSVEPDVLKQKPVLEQLARLFAQLYACKMSSVDSAPFIKTLELDNGVQQDCHEFMTLLLSLLESCLAHSKVSSARSVVQDLFRGIVSHVTICSSCQKDSEASSKMEDFYELELNIKGLKTLDESLDDYLSVEELDGENQYFCESCEQRVRASRRIKLRSLPNVLNFQLKRCIFLPKTTTNKKITSSFFFPGVLDMRERLSESSSSSWTYDLSAVLLHKGTAVNSGHYIAHIKDQNTGVWWEFDDEQVTKLGSHPFGESSSKDAQTANAGSEKCEATATENDCRSNAVVSNHAKVFSSSDAYMLMYTRRVTTPCDGASVQSNQEISLQDACLPAYLLQEVETVNASYVSMWTEYDIKKEKMESHITERRQEVRSVLAEAPVQANESSYFWVSTDWLRQWSDTIHPTAVDNTTIQCMHGKVSASKLSFMKRVGAQAWVKIISKYDGGPALSNADQCTDCLRDGAKSIVSADSYRDRRVKMREVAALVLSGQCSNGEFYVSRTWLQQWFRRKNVDAPSEADGAPTGALCCPHGLLLPEKASGARRLLVPPQLWHFIYEDAMAVKNDASSECKMFSEDSDLCAHCTDELSEVASWEDSQRLLKVKQRQNHEKLSSGKKIPLSLHANYYLVPTAWLLRWKNYISSSGKNSVDKPETLDVIIDSLKCEKHLRLSERPPEVEWKRGVLFQKGSLTDGLTIIPEDDWHSFCEEWGGHKQNSISATIACSSGEKAEEDVNPSSEELVTQTDTSSNNPVLKTVPELCAECVGDKESHQLIEKLNYCDELICVTLVHGKEAPKSFLEAPETERRTTKRSRKTRDANTVHLKVSGSTSIYQLKMMIWESLGVVKENQIIRKGQRVIDDESATLADCSVFPGDKLWVQDSEIYEPRDIADELGEQRMGAGLSEGGFRGTILSADKSSQSV